MVKMARMNSMRMIILITVSILLLFSFQAYGSGTKTLRFYWYEDRFIDIMKQYIREFETENPGTKIDLQIIPWGSYYEKLPVMMASGTAPDIFFLASGQVQNYASMGTLLDLGQYFPPDELKKFRPSQVKLSTYRGKLIAVPFTATILTLYINKDLFKKVGIDTPVSAGNAWDWDEFRYALGKVKSADKLTYGMLNGGRDFWWLPWFYANDASLLNDSLDRAAINTPEAEETLSFLAGLTRENLMAPPGEATELFYQGKTAIYGAGHWDVLTISKAIGNRFKLGAVFFPRRKARSLALGGDYLAIYSKTKEPDLAVKFLQFLTSKRVMADYCARFYYIPPREDAIPHYGGYSDIMDLAQAQAAALGCETLTFHRGLPYYPKIATVFEAEYQLVMLGQKSAKAALKSIESRINEVLSGK